MFEGLLQPMHLIVVLAIVLLLFGPSKLAGLGKGMGDAIRGFKSSMREGEAPSEPAEPVITRPAAAQNDAKV